MADNVYGDPNRQYGIPGIDDQVAGSAAQQAGVAAYQKTYSQTHDTDQAAQAAVNASATSGSVNPLTQWEASKGTTSPNSAPLATVQAAWQGAGSLDYNALVAAGVPGFQSSNPSITPGSGLGSGSPYAEANGGGLSLSAIGSIFSAIKSQQDSANAALASAQQQVAQLNAQLQATTDAATKASLQQQLIQAQQQVSQANQQLGSLQTASANATEAAASAPAGSGTATAAPASLDAGLSQITSWVQIHPMEALLGGGLLLFVFGGKRR